MPRHASFRRGYRRTTRFASTLLASAFLIACATPGSAAESGKRYVLRGERAQVCNAIGDVSIVQGSGSEFIVEVTMHGRDADRLRVEVGPCDGADRLRVVYPGNKIEDPELNGESRHETTMDGCCRGERYRFVPPGNGGIDARAEMVIRVPRDSKLGLGLAAGNVKSEGLNGSLAIDTGSAEVFIKDLTGKFALDSGSGGATITGLRGALSIDCGSGGLNLEDVDGRVSIDCGSGNVTLSRVRGDKMSIEVGSGTVKGDDVVAAALAVSSGSGGIDLARVNGKTMSFDSGSGGVRADLVDSPTSLHIESGSGGVQLTAPRDLDAVLQISCSKKRLDLDMPLTASKISSDYFEGRAGSGNGLIVIESGSGRVSLQSRSN